MSGENIAAVKELLHSIGFDSGLEQALRANTCYLPASFDLRHTMNRGGDLCDFTFYITLANEVYQCTCYDAVCRKEVVIEDAAAASLETRMRIIDWHAMPSPATFDEIESIMQDLQQLMMTDVSSANLLMYKFWPGTALSAKINDGMTLRARYEVSQRFYITAGIQPISMDEAFRFLQSQWQARQTRRRTAPPPPAAAPKGRKAPKRKQSPDK